MFETIWTAILAVVGFLFLLIVQVVIYGGLLFLANYVANALFGVPMLTFDQLCGVVFIILIIKAVFF